MAADIFGYIADIHGYLADHPKISALASMDIQLSDSIVSIHP